MLFEGPKPQESESQRIGNLADQCFNANRPCSWRPHSLGGTDDFGFDYQVQTVFKGTVQDVFRVQLKGSLSPDLNSTGEYFSVELKTSTLRYYSQVTEAILLIFSDLSENPECPSRCPLYFCWVQDEIERYLDEGIPPEKKYVTFRVPKKNNLTNDTSIREYLDRYRATSNIGFSFARIIKKKLPALSCGGLSEISKRIFDGIAVRGESFLHAMAEDPNSPWPEAPQGSFAWFLNQASQCLRYGDDDEMEKYLTLASNNIAHAVELEHAEYWYLNGRLKALIADHDGARDFFLQAVNSGNLTKHIVAWAEEELRFRHSSGANNDFSDIKAKLIDSNSLSQSMYARVLVAEGKSEEALSLVETIPGWEGWIAKAITHMVRFESEKVVEACNAGLNVKNLPGSIAQWFFLLRARARFYLSMGGIEYTGSQIFFPTACPPNADIKLLQIAWSDIENAVNGMRNSGWPSYTEFIADIWGIVASMLGRQREALPDLIEAANKRKSFPMLQTVLESIATQCTEFTLALEANLRQPEDNTTLLRRVALLYLGKKDHECVDLISQRILDLPRDHHLFGPAISLGILSAERIIRRDLVREWLKIIESNPIFAPHCVLLEFFCNINKNALNRDAYLADLSKNCIAMGYPSYLALPLFIALDSTNPEDATKCILLAERIETKHLLDADGKMHLAQAMITLGCWDQLLNLAQEAIQRFNKDDRFLSLKALALDKLGKTADSLESLRELIGQGRGGQIALEVYINIVARSDFIEEAIRSIETILSSETEKSKRLKYLRMLFQLIHFSDPANPRALEIVWEFGQITNQMDEVEEGSFLLAMFSTTMCPDAVLSESQGVEFQQRLEAYSKNFPNSRLLKRVTLPQNATPDDFLRIFRQTIGDDDVRQRLYKKFENLLQQGILPIPYAWRPFHFLPGIPDLPTLWEMGKAAKHDDHRYHLAMVSPEWNALSSRALRGLIPILDLVTLLLVFDLGIFELLFDVFPEIAIGQATIHELISLTAPMSGCRFRQRLIALRSALSSHFHRIRQPSVTPTEGGKSLPAEHWPLEEVKKLAASGQYKLYSDDVFFREYCNMPGIHPSSICTLDVLLALDEGGFLTAENVASKIATLCSWHVGVVIPARYQIAILPENLDQVATVEQRLDLIRNSAQCADLYNAIWDVRKPYESVQSHASVLLRDLISNPRNNIESIAALMCFWYIKAKLRADSQIDPPLKRILLVIAQAASRRKLLTTDQARALWRIFLYIVEIEHGKRMDERNEQAAITLAGQVAAEIDLNQQNFGASSLRHLFGIGLTEGTSDSDLFCQTYTAYRLANLIQPKPRRQSIPMKT